MTQCVFPTPQWKLLPDPTGVRMYGNVSNRLEIATSTGTHSVAVAIPTDLFTFLKDALAVRPDEAVSLAIDEVGERFVLSLMRGDDKLYDLWDYSEKSLPLWMLNPAFFVD